MNNKYKKFKINKKKIITLMIKICSKIIKGNQGNLMKKLFNKY